MRGSGIVCSMPAEIPRIVARLAGEIAIKAPATRRQFERRLRRNLRDALRAAQIDAELEFTRDRYYLHSGTDRELALLARIFGLQSAALCWQGSARTLEEVVSAGVRRFAERVAGRRFAVRARRVGGAAHTPVSGREVERELGRALDVHALRVDLGDPEVVVRLELHGQRVLWIDAERSGPGGLPLGVEGHALALLSGGYDSAVAAWQLLRRGVALDFVFCNLGGADHAAGVIEVAKVLADRWCSGSRPRLHAVDFAARAAEIRARCKSRFWQLVLKRQMLRAAQQVARERYATALITGDALGQVSSQTLVNLAVISAPLELPILRPLVGSNKDDIVRQAEAIGTGELSATVAEYCAMDAPRPATAARRGEVDAEEGKLPAADLASAVATRAIYDLRALDLEAQRRPELALAEIPREATVIDLRSAAAYGAWHYPGALRLDFDAALAASASLPPGRHYVLYCEVGIKSAHVAERIRGAGREAHHIAGGLRGAARCAQHRGAAGPEWVAGDAGGGD